MSKVTKNERISTLEDAVAVNNQGEPLTAAEVGL